MERYRCGEDRRGCKGSETWSLEIFCMVSWQVKHTRAREDIAWRLACRSMGSFDQKQMALGRPTVVGTWEMT